MSHKCLLCYKEITKETGDFHLSCSKKFFGEFPAPILNYTEKEMESLAYQVIKSQTSVTGAQAKLSLDIDSSSKENPSRFTIVGLWGQYILKPPTELYANLPEIEDITMHLASLSNIKVVPHTLIRLKTGNLAYITKRIDRVDGKKIHMEDMCQLTEKLTEHKYRSSHEQIAKTITQYSSNPGLDIFSFFELTLFSFLTGNADMHLKNFSLIDSPNIGYTFCPGYDLVATELVMGDKDNEELALTLNGKKRKLKRKDFETAMQTAKMTATSINNLFKIFEKAIPSWFPFIQNSFLPEELKVAYIEMVKQKAKQIDIMI